MSDSSEEGPIGVGLGVKVPLKGIAVKKVSTAIGSAPSLVTKAAATKKPGNQEKPEKTDQEARNASLAPVVRKTTFAPSVKPTVAPLSKPVTAAATTGPSLTITEKKDETSLEAELDVLKSISKKPTVRAGKFAPPADAPLMESNQLTADFGRKILGPNPVIAHPEAAEGYRPIGANNFNQFIIETYSQYSPYLTRFLAEGAAAAAVPKELDKDACKKRDPNKVETFYYQSFVRDYLNRGSPYRGLLVYHGLGTGKTCTSIAAAEALYWGGQKTIFVLTPATLSNNYRKDLGKCGYYPLRQNNNWSFLKLPEVSGSASSASSGSASSSSSTLTWLTQVFGLPEERVIEQGGGWVPNPDKPSNWDTLKADAQTSIRAQQLAHLNHRFKFIHYNGVLPKTLSDLAAWGVREGKSMFDNAVVIIDEVHNLVRTINGTQIGKKPISRFIDEVEPREFTWSMPLTKSIAGYRYPRGYTFYRLLQNAVGAKVIALSATPMINYAQEMSILLNVIGGEQRIVEISLKSMARDPATTRQLEDWAKKHPQIDFFKVEEGSNTEPVLTVTPVPYGFVKVVTGSYETRGFVRVPPASMVPVTESNERNMDRWAVSLLKELEAAGLLRGGSVEAETAVAAGRAKGTVVDKTPQFRLITVPLLPEDPELFVSNFIDRDTLKVKNVKTLQAKARGLISYYRGGSEELMPRTGKSELVLVPMSDPMFKRYTAVRLAELDEEPAPEEEEEEKKTKTKKKGLTAAEIDLYAQAVKSPQTGFLAMSRAACNWVFPEEVPRPTVSKKQQEKLLGLDQEKRVIAADAADTADEETAEKELNVAASSSSAAAPGAPEEEKEEVAVEDEAPPPPPPVDAEVANIIGTLMSGLEAKADVYLNTSLPEYSPKYATMLANIRKSPGPALVYSQFKTLEGLGIFAAALRASPEKYLPLDLVRKDGEWVIPEGLMTEGKLRYILYTGDQEAEKKRLLLQLYNADLKNLPTRLADQCKTLLAGEPDNRNGRVCRVFMITASGAEGISLFNTRQVHIMEPYWNNVRLQQVIGRAIRLCSHAELPWDDREVDVYTYLSVFSEKQKGELPKMILTADQGKTTDQIIFEIATRKQQLADALFEVAQSSAVDCTIHQHEHGKVTQCYAFGSSSDQPYFVAHPDWRKDLKDVRTVFAPSNSSASSASSASSVAGPTA
jgi:hypothetical protein